MPVNERARGRTFGIDAVEEANNGLHLRAPALQIAEQPEALGVAEQALDRYRALPRRRLEVESRRLERLGTILVARGDYDAARVHYEEELERAGGVRGVDIKGQLPALLRLRPRGNHHRASGADRLTGRVRCRLSDIRNRLMPRDAALPMTAPFAGRASCRHLYVPLDCAPSHDRSSLHPAPVAAPRLVPQRVSWARGDRFARSAHTPRSCRPGRRWRATSRDRSRQPATRPALYHLAAGQLVGWR